MTPEELEAETRNIRLTFINENYGNYPGAYGDEERRFDKWLWNLKRTAFLEGVNSNLDYWEQTYYDREEYWTNEVVRLNNRIALIKGEK